MDRFWSVWVGFATSVVCDTASRTSPAGPHWAWVCGVLCQDVGRKFVSRMSGCLAGCWQDRPSSRAPGRQGRQAGARPGLAWGWSVHARAIRSSDPPRRNVRPCVLPFNPQRHIAHNLALCLMLDSRTVQGGRAFFWLGGSTPGKSLPPLPGPSGEPGYP
jgi:hypothetical protein